MRWLILLLAIGEIGCASSKVNTPFLWAQNKIVTFNEGVQARGYWSETLYIYNVALSDDLLKECYGDLSRRAPQTTFYAQGNSRYLPQWDQVVFNKEVNSYSDLRHEYSHALTHNPLGASEPSPFTRSSYHCMSETVAQMTVKIGKLLDQARGFRERERLLRNKR